MYEQAGPVLQTNAGENIALQSVGVEVVFRNLLCETAMTQVYQNLEQRVIEAVYTFPLPSRSLLLSLKVVIGGRELQGVVVEKASAAEKYEEAITDGNAAIMLEQVQAGLYAMNVGNILAGETVSISFSYAELLFWQGDTLRFHIPTAIAPRYGSPEAAGLQPHQTPEYNLLVENCFQLRITLSGTLTDAFLDSPFHQLAISKSKSDTIVTLATGEAAMDRDFILNIRSNQAKDAALISHDINGGFVVLASFVPRLPLIEKAAPKSIKIVIDCSGSMAGDSISQAIQAISDILDHLRPEDFFNLIAFGSTFKAFFERQMPADKKNITQVRRLVRSLNADMGGTEIRQALQAAIHLSGPDIPQDILLVTDGEVWESDEIVSMVKKSGHRIFTVGVGSSVSEGFVRQLARETGGACELVAPREKMAEKIVRHFKRIYLPRAEDVSVCWPITPEQVIPHVIGPVYDWDTVHVFGCFIEKPSGPVVLNMTIADGRTFSQSVILPVPESALPENSLPGTIARFAVHEALAEMHTSEATKLAVQYQLITPYTNYLVVAARAAEEKGHDLPALRKVPQMLAAGWGGTGSILLREPSVEYNRPMFSRTAPEMQIRFQKTLSPEQKHKNRQKTTPASFVSSCNHLHTRWLLPRLQLISFDDLLDCDLPDRIKTAIEAIARQYDPETPQIIMVLAFLMALAESNIGGGFNRNTKRAITRADKTIRPDKRFVRLLANAFADISQDDWGAAYPLEDDGQNA